MFKFFIRYAVFVMLLLPSVVSASDDCVIKEDDVDSLFEFYKSNCKDQTGKSLCDCLKSQQKNHVFIEELFKKKDDMKVSKEEFVKKQTQRLLSVYKDMTYGASYQKAMFNIESKKTVGCPATKLRENYEAAIRKHTTEKLKANHDNVVSESLRCKTPEECNKAQDDLVLVTKELADVENKVKNACNSLSKIMQSIADQGSSDPLIRDLEKALAWYTSKKASDEKIQEIKDAILGLTNIQKPKSLPDYDNQNFGVLPTQFVPNNLVSKHPTCPGDAASISYQSVMSTFHDDLSNSKEDLEKITKVDPSDDLLQQISNFNSKVENDLKNKFDTVGPNSCYTYGEYKILKSQPSPYLVQAINETPLGLVANFFAPSSDMTKKLEVEKLNYLRANPAIANTLSVSCAGYQFPQAMKTYAASIKGLSPKEQMRAYLDFMKKDGAQLLGEEEVKLGEYQNCVTLGENIAAVFLTDEPGPVPEFKTNNPMQMLSQQILSCKTAEASADSQNNIMHTLTSNPLYLVQGNEDPEVQDKIDEEDYKKFLAENCIGFAQKREAAIKAECSKAINFEECRKDFDKADKTANLRQKYFDDLANREQAGVRDLIRDDARPVFTPADHQAAASVNSDAAQDPEVARNYEINVRPYLTKPILAQKGEEASFTAATEYSQEVIASASTFNSPSGQTTPTVAEVDWTKPNYPEVTPETLASAQIPKLLPPSYNNQSATEKIEILQATKQNVVAEATRLASEAKTVVEKQKIISDLRKSVNSMDAEVEKLESLSKATNKIPTPTSTPNYASGNETKSSPDQKYKVASGSEGGTFSGASTSQSSAAGSFQKVSESAKEKMNDAYLKSKYRDGEAVPNQDRSPASTQDETVKIIVGPSMTSQVSPGSQLLSQLPLDSTSFANKDLILEKVKLELEKNKVKKSENVLIQFFDKTKNEVLIVNVSWVNSQWVISQVPRKSLLSNLNLTLISQTNL